MTAVQAEWQLNGFEIIGKRRTLTKLLPTFSQKIDDVLSRVRPTFPQCHLAWG
ncbi:hypothetical protein YSA_07718 [Pseudomonas putida ND6]|uniref:Uncharacterized protein n=1 Tax=Pseudomonas putida ND6 TaxID=231023 RepID=I3UZM1_PSEPU|nr:hypothetical protein YSA_07718 [Pseudomonas putida ND6]